MMKRYSYAVLFMLLGSAGTASADSVLSMHHLFNGRNIYSATLLNDGIYKMWYGGWQNDSDYPNDKIYYRTSTDNSSWSSHQTVLTTSQIPGAEHVNDPSVTKHFNESSGQWQYTMFYTVCKTPCELPAHHEIWSSVSLDGISWSNHQDLSISGGPAEPSVILETGGGGQFWAVYYVDRQQPTQVRKAKVTGNRTLVPWQTWQTVYSGNDTIANPEVEFFNGKWHLFFNVWLLPYGGDIYKSESPSNISWYGKQLLIHNSGSVCSTTAPGILPASGSQYDMYFGQHPTSEGPSCPMTNHTSIHRWRWTD